MTTRRLRSPAVLKSGLVLVCTLLALLVAAPARADVGVQPILPGGSNISPEDETPIQMVAEKVVLNVRAAIEADNAVVTLNPAAYGFEYYEWAPRWFTAVGDVEADFAMNNPATEAVSMAVWFPLASALQSVEWDLNHDEIVPRIEGLQVQVDGEPVVLSESEWPNPKGEDKPPLPWASFPVIFPAGKQTNIHVSYTVPAERTLDDIGMRLFYVFQTGAGWAGPIGKAELIVNLPFPASAETIGAMPEGGQAEGERVTWTWEDLEPGPQDDFAIWLLLPERWEALQAARAAVEADPKDGEAWLKLASTYHRLILGKYEVLPGFGETYQPLGVQAAKEALPLLPGDGRPHYELAIFYLSALPANPSPEELEPFLDELRLVDKLAPSYAGDVHDWFEFIMGIDSWNDYWAAATATAARIPRPSKLPIPSATPQLPPTATPAVETGGTEQTLAIIGAAVAVGLMTAVGLASRRWRARTRKQTGNHGSGTGE
jgi:hypothetical protein